MDRIRSDDQRHDSDVGKLVSENSRPEPIESLRDSEQTNLLNEFKQLRIGIEEYLQNIPQKPRIEFADADQILVSTEGLYLSFPKQQLNHAISYLNPSFDKGLRAFLYARIKPGMVFIDVGANVGVISGIGAKLVGQSGKIITVEPIASLDSNIKQNIFLNAPLTEHTHFAAALGAKAGKKNIQLFHRDNRVSTLHFDTNIKTNDDHETREIDVIDVSSVLPKSPNNMFLKIDAEGCEAEILEAAFNFWQGQPLQNTIIVFEYGSAHLSRAGVDQNAFIDLILSSGITAQRIHPLSGLLDESISKGVIPSDGNYAMVFD